MLIFRKMVLEDLDEIYGDGELRPLLTTLSSEERFGVVIELDGSIIGGVTGSIVDKNAIVQELIVKRHDNYIIYKDGLIRSLIHTLELDGVNLLFVNPMEDIELYTNIGFRKNDKYMVDYGQDSFYIDLKGFFCNKIC